jgi:predicted dehydrogenase
MSRDRIRTAIVGTGFMGRVHAEAVRRVGLADLVTVVGRDAVKARTLASEFAIPDASVEFDRALRDDVDAVHICTRNAQHHAMAAAALDAGKHVLCEKPLALTCEDGADLVARAAAKRLRNATCHNLRYYPMVQQMRRMCESGELGDVLIVQGTYAQDWLLYETDWNWRVDANDGGTLRAMADIGTHWCDMVEHVTGLRISRVCADLATFHRTRQRPVRSVDSFAAAASAATETATIATEDFGAVLLRLGDRARGAFTVSQVSAGCKNRLSIEIYGTRRSVMWNQERPDELWIGRRDGRNEVMLKDPSLLAPGSAPFADLPGGHSEGYDDTFKQLFRRFYQSIADPASAVEYPQFADGLRQLIVLDAIRASDEHRQWTEVVGREWPVAARLNAPRAV